MSLHYSDEWLTIYAGDAREVLVTLDAESVDCVVTSPPYWGLRDYGTATWVGGDEACDHRPDVAGRAQRPAGGLTGGKAHVDAGTVSGGDCGRCDATRVDSQLGLERTPEEYVANLVAVFAEVRRVLKPSGTCWLNLGDSYGHGTDARRERSQTSTKVSVAQHEAQGGRHGGAAKQLVGIPWRVAFALQADGWYLRSDIIWSKPNPMPESVTDRPTKSHEYLFLLTKSSRYYFDADAVREDGAGRLDLGRMTSPARLNQGGEWTRTDKETANGRNIRSVWTIATRPYPGAHFAVFPPELPERCIKAGSSEKGVCPECGKPWERVTKTTLGGEARIQTGVRPAADERGVSPSSGLRTNGRTTWNVVTTGWRSVCDHPLKPEPAVILDPFAGSGTVGMVANHLSRRAILVDLNPDYITQQMKRNANLPLGLGAT